MGKLLKPRGLKGVLWLSIFNEIDSSLKKGKKIWVKLENKHFSNLLIESLFISGDKSWIKLNGYNSREDAVQLSGLPFSISRSDFPSLSDEDFYLVDMVGCNVIDINQNSIGSVVDTMILPKQNLLVINTSKEEILIPFVDQYVKLFDKNNKIIILKDVESFLN